MTFVATASIRAAQTSERREPQVELYTQVGIGKGGMGGRPFSFPAGVRVMQAEE